MARIKSALSICSLPVILLNCCFSWTTGKLKINKFQAELWEAINRVWESLSCVQRRYASGRADMSVLITQNEWRDRKTINNKYCEVLYLRMMSQTLTYRLFWFWYQVDGRAEYGDIGFLLHECDDVAWPVRYWKAEYETFPHSNV